MKEELLKEAKFDVEIKTPGGVNVKEKELSYGAAMALCEHILEQNPDDETLQEQLSSCMNHFGFQGFWGAGGYSITISAYKPIIQTEEKHTCPERMNGFGPWDKEENLDTWEIRGQDKCCSFCGSMHPDRVLELVKEQGFKVISRSDKQYKWYIEQANVPNASFGGIKYYRWHDTEEFINGYNELVSQHKNQKQ
jgi:hypothetical protein